MLGVAVSLENVKCQWRGWELRAVPWVPWVPRAQLRAVAPPRRDPSPPPLPTAEHSLFAGVNVWAGAASGGRNMPTKDLNTEQNGLEASQTLPLARTEEACLILGWCGKWLFALRQNKRQPWQDAS